MSAPDHRSGSNLTHSHLRIYRRIADGNLGAFMAPADVRDLLDEIDRLEAERDVWKRVAERAGVCMTCALGAPDISIGCTDCLNTGFAHGAPQGYVSESFHAEALSNLSAAQGGR